jgi:hypothetical protein
MRVHDGLMESNEQKVVNVNLTKNINVDVVFHMIVPNNSVDKMRVSGRAKKIISSINADFNNYSDQNRMNNFRYRTVVNQVFL